MFVAMWVERDWEEQEDTREAMELSAMGADVNSAVYDVQIAHLDVWCDDCKRMVAYCVCGRL